jgi:hypothetical protein
MNSSTIPEHDHVAPFQKGHVSWVKSYRYIGRIGNGYHYKIEAERSGSMDAVFCRAVDFWDVVDKTPSHSDVIDDNSFWIIVEDCLPDVEIDRFVHTNRKSLVISFMNASNKLHYNRLTLRLLDGVIQKELQKICEG